MPNYPYELWNTRQSLGVMRDVKPEYEYWLPYFTQQINSEEEYIDFEKLPIFGRKLAAFTMPLARGKPVYSDRATLTRFKPAYVKVEDQIDPLMPLTRRPGIDSSVVEPVSISPMQRIELIRAAMTIQHVNSVRRRWDWMASKAIIDGRITISGENYPTTLVDFARDAGHTVVLGSGNRFGDSGVSIVDFIQSVVDTMTNASFGAVPTKITMGGAVAAVMRKDPEVLSHLDKMVAGGSIRVDRGVVSGAKIYKFGELMIGGQSGQVIELWVNNEVYVADDGTSTRYVPNNAMIFTGDPSSIMGYRCFGRIIDRAANYAPLDIFPSNWVAREGDVEVEYLTHKSAPLFVPIAANSTFKATVLA